MLQVFFKKKKLNQIVVFFDIALLPKGKPSDCKSMQIFVLIVSCFFLGGRALPK